MFQEGGILVDISLLMESVLGAYGKRQIEMSFLCTAPGHASPPSAESAFSGPKNLEKWGGFAGN